MSSAATLYLDLLKKAVLGELYVENELRLLYLRDCLGKKRDFEAATYLDIRRRDSETYQEYVANRTVGINYERTIDNLGFQHTMIGRKRLENIEYCLDLILRDGIEGDVIECGVWRGGAALYMRGFFAAHEIPSRVVWLADSFEGLPPPSHERDAGLDLSARNFPMLAIDEDTVRDLFERYGLLDEQVRFLKGWFKDTLHTAPIQRLSLLRIDADLYESTRDCLTALYPKLEAGGLVVVDDYGCLPACRQAVSEFRTLHSITEPIHEIDWTGIYWRKE